MTGYLIDLLAYAQFSALLAYVMADTIADAWPELRR